MTVVERPWREVAPVRGAFARVDVLDDALWSQRLWSDRERTVRNQTPDLLAVTAIVEARSRELGADALILSGSTARARRTRISDLDYHVIGARPDVTDLPEDIDLYTDTPVSFEQKLRAGDDFAHWSVWYGCVLFDSGVVRTSAASIAREDLWPDPGRKLEQARTTLEFAYKMVASGDDEAALEQVRAAPLARRPLVASDARCLPAGARRAERATLSARAARACRGAALMHSRAATRRGAPVDGRARAHGRGSACRRRAPVGRLIVAMR